MFLYAMLSIIFNIFQRVVMNASGVISSIFRWICIVSSRIFEKSPWDITFTPKPTFREIGAFCRKLFLYVHIQGISKPCPPIPGPSGATLGKTNDCPVKYIRFAIDLPRKDNYGPLMWILQGLLKTPKCIRISYFWLHFLHFEP